jgi:hypothetical protein
MLRVKIETDNAAFAGDGEQEVARLLRIVAERVADGQLDGVIRDINGNRCGEFDLRLERVQGEDANAEG